MSKRSLNFRQRKWTAALAILGIGMGVALLWSLIASQVLDKGYPQSYVLGPPVIRFNDFTDATFASVFPNPYTDPFALYPPATFAFFRALAWSNQLSLIFICFVSVTALAFLLEQMLRPILHSAWWRVSLTFLFLAVSYPIVFCVDRGNIEIILVPLMCWAAYLMSHNRETSGALCLIPAICFKLYPAIFLVLLLRRGKIGLAVICLFSAVFINALCCFGFHDSPLVIWNSYRGNLPYYRDYTLVGIFTLEGSASLWNTYKLLLVALQKLDVIQTINFGFDGSFIQASYLFYTTAFGLLTLICVVYVWLCEINPMRSIVLLLLLVSISAPSGADYRLMYASMALIFMVALAKRRSGDWVVLFLIALAVIPKREFLLTFAGGSETGYFDVSIQTLVNPLLILAAMLLLLYEARDTFVWNRMLPRLRASLGSWPNALFFKRRSRT